MKKLVLTVAIVLGLGMTSFADPNGGLFQRGNTPENPENINRDGGLNLTVRFLSHRWCCLRVWPAGYL
jgi:hypothetical protein